MKPLSLYTRRRCHLCEELLEALEPAERAGRISVTPVDVDGDPALRERYGLRVPVLVDEHGAVICEGRAPDPLPPDWPA